MILKELNLIGFGKYENRTIKLEDGINIIYGENESGKTTIHSFIDGMFYGFLKPYVKSTLYLEEHKRFTPWTAQRYAGVVRLSHNGILYRIEREFTKNREETKVLIENTGEDITNTINNGVKGRVLQPGFYFFGFNNIVYSNTVSIKQLATKTEDKLADEVRDKLINVTTALNDEISVDNALKDLNKSLKDIGTIKAPTSIYGMTNTKILKLQEEKEKILQLKEEYVKLLDDESKTNNALNNLQIELDNQKIELKKAEYNRKKSIYKEALGISEELIALELKLDELKQYKDLSSEDYSGAISLTNNINIIDSKIEDYNIQINELRVELETMKNKVTSQNDENTDEISKDYLNFEKMEEDKNKLIYGQDSSSLEFFSRDYNTNNSLKGQYYLLLMISIIGYVFTTYIAIGSWTFLLLTQLFIIPIVLFIKKIRRLKGLLNRIESHITEFELDRDNRKEGLANIETEQNIILSKYNITSKPELRNLYDNINQQRYKRNEWLEAIKEHQNKLALIQAKIIDLSTEKQTQTKKLELILSDNFVINLDEFSKGLNNKNSYDDIYVDIRNKKELLKRILGNFTLKELKIDLENEQEYNSNDLISIELIKTNIEDLKDSLSQALVDKKSVEERINHINPRISRLVELDEELIREKSLLENFDNKRDAIELAKSTIEDLSKDIHNQFAPEINKKVGNIVSKITGGKYSGVRIDNNLGIGVIDPITGEIVEVNSLSGGTIDQLYFSLRFGIMNSMVDDNLPLILDDCFIQYDDNRLNNILRFLITISKTRQVILFTCHNRERKLLEDMDIGFNLITLC